MAQASITLTVTAPQISNTNPDAGTRAILAGALEQIAQQIASGAATTGEAIYPPGSTTSLGTWTLTPQS